MPATKRITSTTIAQSHADSVQIDSFTCSLCVPVRLAGRALTLTSIICGWLLVLGCFFHARQLRMSLDSRLYSAHTPK